MEEILKQLPKKTMNGESFGLCIMIDGDGVNWTACYYTHYSNKSDDRIPVIKGETIGHVLHKLFTWFKANMPEALIKLEKV